MLSGQFLWLSGGYHFEKLRHILGMAGPSSFLLTGQVYQNLPLISGKISSFEPGIVVHTVNPAFRKLRKRSMS
jgi:hypothetical protein